MLGVSGSREWRDERAERCVVKAKPTALTDTYWRRMQEGWRGRGLEFKQHVDGVAIY